MANSHDQIIIVGGSLAGLTLALACASRGVSVRVIERSTGHFTGGDSLSVDLDLIAKTVGHDPRVEPVLPVVPAYRDLTTWSALYHWLRARASEANSIMLDEGRTVAAVAEMDNGTARLTFEDGSQLDASAVIGADGYRSIVRQAIAPNAPLARYSGYVVWRGLIEEKNLNNPVSWPSDGGLWIEFVEGYRLVAAVLPGRDGSVEPGHRQITFAWFDAHQESLLRDMGCLTNDGFITSTLARGAIDEAVRLALVDRASRIWPETWSEAVVTGIRSKNALSGAPIAEYKPQRLARGVLAIIGDAAHLISPMTGRGFLTGVEDAWVLANLLATKDESESYSDVLRRYEQARWPFIRGLVRHSEKISAEYVQIATASPPP